MKSSLLSTVIVLAAMFAFTVNAEESSRLNVISFSSQAQAEVPNDQIEITLTVEKQARRAADLAAAVNSDMQWALEIARKDENVESQTRDYRTEPRYDNSGTVIGWRATQTLQLRATEVKAATALSCRV